jgi:hypothetical protein
MDYIWNIPSGFGFEAYFWPSISLIVAPNTIGKNSIFNPELRFI